jgi:hypothetical protein
MEYKILVVKAGSVWKTHFEQAAQEMSRRVNQAIGEGWEPLGGVNVGKTAATERPFLLQAIIKKS